MENMDKGMQMDLQQIVANIEKVKKMKAAKPKKSTGSSKPLKFKINALDSPLKAEIIRRINAKNLTYDDLVQYCIRLKDGNTKEGQTFAYNTITGLSKRSGMMDSTFAILCDFLDLDIILIDRTHPEPYDVDEIESVEDESLQ